MKIKTSVTLSEALLGVIDHEAKRTHENRSQFIEKGMIEYLKHHRRSQRDARELDILNRCASDHHREMAQVLEFQELP